MSALDLDALEALCDAATPGPWVAAPSPWEGVSAPCGDPRDGGSCEIVDCVRGPSHGDAAFIAAAREAVPALITRLRAAESEASHAGVLRCKLKHEEAQTEAAGRALEMVASGLLAEHGAIFSAVLELGARLRAAEARTAWSFDLDAAPRTWVLACEGEIVYKAAPCGDEWVEVGGRTIKPRCWQSLPAAPEAPHV